MEGVAPSEMPWRPLSCRRLVRNSCEGGLSEPTIPRTSESSRRLPLKGDAPRISQAESGLGGTYSLRCARGNAVHEREGNMRNTLGKRGSAIFALAAAIAAIAAIAAGPAAAAPAKTSPAPAAVAAPVVQVTLGIDASWA